ncbi:Aste57867_8342 [Aphanomyces stellatus]|uniref:Aste57867_8342 protein n=1 Tax=Aphanomyces stellatus TaxID=120398 RepID=A0A485KK22_9STRA|nr:hypothetical protein As57867_008310 [Aphanomyces stellatus]VFT85229.1 Aste57867_8342 [Aphanomyces stellatus]
MGHLASSIFAFLALAATVWGNINTCVSFSASLSGAYVLVQLDSNGDVATLSNTPGGIQMFSPRSSCESASTADKVIAVSCGCGYLSLSGGSMTGYDQGPSFWCNTGKTALGADPPNPNCTPPPPTTTVPPTTIPPPTTTPVLHAAC